MVAILIMIVVVVECNSRAYFGTETTRVMVNNVEHTLNVHNVEHTLCHTIANVLGSNFPDQQDIIY